LCIDIGNRIQTRYIQHIYIAPSSLCQGSPMGGTSLLVRLKGLAGLWRWSFLG
jgi:hypothetical protein